MPRWEPNTPLRLHTAALELFAEQGYEATTAAGIAERAGLAKSGFFRHFADKREVLFFGQDLINDHLGTAIAAASGSSAPLAMVGEALALFEAAFTPERRPQVRTRQAIIDAHPDLRERELLKRASMTATLAGALEARGVPAPTARLAGTMGDLALNLAYVRWLSVDDDTPFGAHVRRAIDELRTASATV